MVNHISLGILDSFGSIEDWVIFGSKEGGVVREDSLGVASLYNFTSSFMAVAG